MSNPVVSVVILNYRNARQAVRCVQMLRMQTVSDRMEIIVVDNHSDDDSIGILRSSLTGMERVRIVETHHNGGFGHGYNTGIRYACGEYVLVNNPDKMLQPDGIEKMIDLFRSQPDIGILAPRLLHDDGSQRPSMRATPSPIDLLIKRTFLRHFFPQRMAHYLQESLDPSLHHDVDWVAGGCFMIRRDFFQSLGGFDERFFLFFEDTDLCRRTWQQGKRVVYTPAVAAADKRRRLSDMGALRLVFSRVGRAHIASAFRYFAKWGWS
jgi:GT2 family glycosyltransferase